ncbi:UDP-N-acetylmuramoyl-tripeptide--D-alanyl-D-alanine ligase [Candidatus Wolfebacteria bacterium]|nr:UDP-N-acetylmuramoyl-tripeptide--D-alanyl-D-alanine ligase [Candidatus Wolfebacteria bacterium]
MVKILKYILKQLVRLIIWKFNPEIIAITGSVGKTSAKEAIYAALVEKYKVRKSIGGLNTEIGLPISIIGDDEDFSEEDLKLVAPNSFFISRQKGKKIKKIFFWIKVIFFALSRFIFLPKSRYPKILILECGVEYPNDMNKFLEFIKPKVGVITAIGDIPSHIEFFSNPEAVVREKGKLLENMSVSDFAVLNFDNETVLNLKEKTRAKIKTFGFNEGADARILNFENKIEDGKPVGISFKIESGGSFIPFSFENIFGKSHAYAIAVAVAAGFIFNLNLVKIAESIFKNYKPVKGRMNLTIGNKGIYIIDDTYNASPISMKLAIETLGGLSGKRRVAVLGDMLELGDFFKKAHKDIGKLAATAVDFLVAVGEGGKIIADSAKANGLAENKIIIFENADMVADKIGDIIEKGDIILIKASRGIRLDKIVEKIKK